MCVWWGGGGGGGDGNRSVANAKSEINFSTGESTAFGPLNADST